ncbi:MAG: DegT/DnrJ/EryC1/StrS family aminotransferase [Gomphosphaeria aponina SAG 52.96 = DSM 107014]|uniref:DegT/DnrJ/EryC1/StrS family aminotransferase n=1 Tax=Gomphosphaeria aponina SAG 52.96 = DSM 107014 TaxID=1521640 RepID=A0A941JNQ8_9CHRO|nr:DegT/DnrJ/EryC1/StrS family aminotransferase [Gomphosphaeria aponina SAG 52.96 = DSM 107014]
MQPIPVNEPLLDGNEKKYLSQCIDTGWISSEGDFVKQFETQMANRVRRKYGISVCNGSVALEVAITALGIGQGDEVILPTFTIISCAAAIVRAGATPVVIDCDRLTWNINVNQIQAKITAKTKAIMVVHIYGLPVDLNPILEIADKYGLKIIEDAAEMHGQTYYNKPCGSFGDISTFSFYPNKHITTGEGGMVLTNDEKLAEKCRSLRNLCFQPQQRFIHEDLGWNFRFSNLQAAVGVAQLERLDEFVAKKRSMGKLYTELLADIAQIQLPLAKTDYAENIYWVYGVVLSEELPFDAKEVMERLKEYKIGTRPFFWCMHEQPVFQKMGLFAGVSCPVGENLARRGFYLPSGLALTEEQIQRVAQTLREIIEQEEQKLC